MKSLLERATARPLPFVGLFIAVIAVLFIIWWLLSPSTEQNVTKPTSNIIANQKTAQAPTKQLEAASIPAPTSTSTDTTLEKTSETPASAPLSTTAAVVAIPTAPAVNAALPTDRATAAEELDRLKDEQARLKERKKDLAKQLAISNKLLALKEQQLKTLGQLNP